MGTPEFSLGVLGIVEETPLIEPTSKPDVKRRVLLLNLQPDIAAIASPLLGRQNLDVDRLRASPAALELIRRVHFDLIFVGTPLSEPSLPEVLVAVRKPDSPNRTTSLLLLSEPQGEGFVQAEKGLQKGANTIVTLPLSGDEFGKILARYLSIAPRKNARVTLRIEVKFENKSKLIICQTANISGSGMLLRTAEVLPAGTRLRLQFTLPNVKEALQVEGLVARLSNSQSEKLPGVGISFTKISVEDRERLHDYLDALT